MTEKACMIVSVWFGPRRSDFNSPISPEEQVKYLKSRFLFHAKQVDPGVDMDLILVCSVGGSINAPEQWVNPSWAGKIEGDYDRKNYHLPTMSHVGYEYIQSIDGESIRRGKIKVHFRRNSSGKGYDAFAYGFKEEQDNYDYFLFCEDDVTFFRDNYFKVGIETLKKNQPEAQCVGYSPLDDRDELRFPDSLHFHGALYMSSREILKSMAKDWTNFYNTANTGQTHPVFANFPHLDENQRRIIEDRLPHLEVPFSNHFVHMKKREGVDPHKVLIRPDGIGHYARNWTDVLAAKEIFDDEIAKGRIPKTADPCHFVGFERE